MYTRVYVCVYTNDVRVYTSTRVHMCVYTNDVRVYTNTRVHRLCVYTWGGEALQLT